MKLIGLINWVFIGLIGLVLVYGLTLMNPHPDAAGRGVETSLFVFAFFVLLVLVGMNLLPYTWVKITAFIVELLIIFLIYYLRTH